MKGNFQLWHPEDEVTDHTSSIKKLWDNIIPKKIPYITKFQTNIAVDVTHIKKIGPYSITENDFKYDADVWMDFKPLYEIGWDGESNVTSEQMEIAYGKNYFDKLRDVMRELVAHIGIHLSVFDFEGDINVKSDD